MSRYLYFPTRKKLEYLYNHSFENSPALTSCNSTLTSQAAYLLLFQLTSCSPKYKMTPDRAERAAEPDISRLWPSNGHTGVTGVISRLEQGPESGHWTRPATWHASDTRDTLADNFIETNCSRINFNVLHLFLPQTVQRRPTGKKGAARRGAGWEEEQ